ncbi:MAG: glycerophosphodiester phosphodiesterase [Desulfobacterales bacterium]
MAHLPPERSDVLRCVEPVFHRVIDFLFATIPRPKPHPARLRQCRVVSHRGEHDNRRILENTMAAFEVAASHGVWGIELDIRWTGDLVPVVIHDADLQRVFGTAAPVAAFHFDGLKARFPQVPSLEEVVAAFGRRLHLMIEIKKESLPDPSIQKVRLAEVLSPLIPGVDYHLMSLHPEVFDVFDSAPSVAYLPIARLQVEAFSRLTLQENYGGITGHYFFIRGKHVRRHRRLGQSIGTGFIGSRNALFREINREVEWVYSNRAAYLQSICRGKSA